MREGGSEGVRGRGREIQREIYTVEPPKKGHFGSIPFVLHSEVVPISEVHM